MNPNIKAVRYYDDGFRLGILVKDDEKRSFIIPIQQKEIRVLKFRTDLEGEVVSEYFDDKLLQSLIAKIKELGRKYGITVEAKGYLT